MESFESFEQILHDFLTEHGVIFGHGLLPSFTLSCRRPADFFFGKLLPVRIKFFDFALLWHSCSTPVA